MSSNAKAIEVLLRTRAFVVKRVGEVTGDEPPSDAQYFGKGQVSWGKHNGPEKAWRLAKLKANFK